MLPITSVTLCAVPWSHGYRHIVDFASRETQASYILSKAVKTYTNFTMVRNDGYIRVPEHVDNLTTCNYVAFKNSGRWFYAFITRMQYVNDDTTWVYFDFDIVQNWMTQYTLAESFVIREHVTDDTIGVNTVPEGLETGDWIGDGRAVESGASVGLMSIIVAVTEVWTGGTTFVPIDGGLYNGIYSGCKYFGFNLIDLAPLNAFLKHYTETSGKADSVVSIFMMPATLIGTFENGAEIPNSNNAIRRSITAISRPTTLNGYTPRNNKLFTFPYCFLYLSNNSGGASVYRYEEFSGTPAFELYGPVAPNPTIKINPTNRIDGNRQDYGLTLAGYPLCSWTSSPYSNWFGQNAGSLALAGASSLLTITAGIATGNPLQLSNGIGSAVSQVAQLSDRTVQPEQSRGTLNSGSANCAISENDFKFYCKTVKAEYAKIIDDFFTCYGYKVNRVKVPNLTGHAGFNFVQTAECVVLGSAPADIKKQIEDIYNSGVTIWHNGDTLGDYGI